MNTTHVVLVFTLSISVLVVTAHQRHLLVDDAASKQGTLSPLDLVIVYTTTTERLPLVHATRPARRNIRTFIAVESESAAAKLNQEHGGPSGQHRETYISWPDVDASGGIGGGGGGSGPYGTNPPPPTHPLHRIGPRWAMAPLLVHELLAANTSAASASATSTTTAVAGAAPPPSPPPLPYRWLLVARDDTLWLPPAAVRLLASHGDGAAAVSDHLLDFNGRTLLAPSPAPAVCLPCGMNLTALLGRRRPPRVPPPGCPVCRPPAGCEFRFDYCRGLAGGAEGVCGSKRFLGSGDRCAHSWVAGGGGIALSAQLMTSLDRASWSSCVRSAGPSTGERSLGRCLWRQGFAVTHPAAGLAAGLTRQPLDPRLILFGNPIARQGLFGSQADTLLGPAYAAAEAAARDAAAKAAASTATAVAIAQPAAAAAAVSVLASTRVAASTAAGTTGAAEATGCNATCVSWVRQNAVSAHLDVPYAAAAAGGGVDVAAAAAVMEEAARAVAKAAGWE